MRKSRHRTVGHLAKVISQQLSWARLGHPCSWPLPMPPCTSVVSESQQRQPQRRNRSLNSFGVGEVVILTQKMVMVPASRAPPGHLHVGSRRGPKRPLAAGCSHRLEARGPRLHLGPLGLTRCANCWLASLAQEESLEKGSRQARRCPWKEAQRRSSGK